MFVPARRVHWATDQSIGNAHVEICDRQNALARNAANLRALGSPFVASVLEAGERQLFRAPRTAALIHDWCGDVAAAALSMRFNTALHALARGGVPAILQALYRRDHDDFDAAVGTAMADHDAFIATWMRDPPQTNEVARAAPIMAALMVAARTVRMPFELLELGSSAGLNLNLGRYAYDLGGTIAGAPASDVKIAPEWRGASPPTAAVEIATARGVDLNPLDAADPKTRERLLSHVFADQPERAARLCAALSLAQRHPPKIGRADAAVWLSRQLSTAQPVGQCRAVFHSMVLQYLDPTDYRTVIDAIAAAGAQATSTRPFVWISLEWTQDRTAVQLWLTSWPDRSVRHLATCHPYGAWIEWHGE